MDHTNKQARGLSELGISGSVKKFAGAESTIMIEAKRNRKIAVKTSDKDSGEPLSFEVEVSRKGSGLPKFKYLREVTEAESSNKGINKREKEELKKIVETLKEKGPLPKMEIKQDTGIENNDTMRNRINKLIEMDEIVKLGEGKNTQYDVKRSSNSAAAEPKAERDRPTGKTMISVDELIKLVNSTVATTDRSKTVDSVGK